MQPKWKEGSHGEQLFWKHIYMIVCQLLFCLGFSSFFLFPFLPQKTVGYGDPIIPMICMQFMDDLVKYDLISLLSFLFFFFSLKEIFILKLSDGIVYKSKVS